ncbi:MAG: arabinofuranosyltransferase [Promethearchaeota archaeon]
MNKEKTKQSLFGVFKSDILQEFFFSGIGCVFFVIFFSFLPKQYWNEPYRTTFLVLLSIIFFLSLIIINQVGKRNLLGVNYKRNIILFSIYIFAIYLFLFYKTRWAINGLAGDNLLRTAYIIKMANSGYPRDYAYKHLSAFYAPLYWYLLALLAIAFHIKPFEMVRIGCLITLYITPIMLFEIWKKIYKTKIAFIIAALCSVLLIDLYSPDKLIGTFLIIPFIMYYYENCTKKDFAKKDYIIGGFFGSIVFGMYFLYFLIIPIYYIILFFQNRSELKKKLKHITYLTISLLLFSSWFWAPLIRDIILFGFESHQQNYFSSSMLSYPLMSFIAFNIQGLAMISGLVYIIRKYNTSNDLKVLGNLLISVHILFLAGFIGVLNNFPFAHHRFFDISYYILYIASCIFYFRFFYFLVQNKNIFSNMKNRNNLFQIEISLLICIIFFTSIHYAVYINNSVAYDTANQTQPQYKREIFEDLDYEDKIFLTNKYGVIAYLPIYLFILPNPYANHPSASYNERVKFLVELSECKSSKTFHEKVVDNEFDQIDYFYLDYDDNSSKFILTVAIEIFPDGREYYDIKFDEFLFANDNYFKKIIIDGEIIFKTKN